MIIMFYENEKCGIGCLDVETNHIFLEQFEGTYDHISHEMRRIINRYRPAEVLLQKSDKEISKICRQICNPFIIEGHAMTGTVEEILSIMKDISKDPIFYRLDLLLQKSEEKDDGFIYYPTIMALGLVLMYLKKLGLEAKIFGQCIFEFTNFRETKLTPMFDAQVYENL